ncbi:MAG: PEP/pyruvate-binding domain-containing protein [Planctomycetota bacterium]
MVPSERPIDENMRALQERAKELNCLYRVDAILSNPKVSLEDALRELLQVIPPGWQHPEVCRVKITLAGRVYQDRGFEESAWMMKAPIAVRDEVAGEIAVCYVEARPERDEGPFLKEERKLINTIASRIGQHILQRQIKSALRSWDSAVRSIDDKKPWRVILAFLRRTDPTLLMQLTRKMINYLCWNGVKDAEKLLQELSPEGSSTAIFSLDESRPLGKHQQDPVTLTERAFQIASEHLSDDEVISNMQLWIKAEKAQFLMTTLEDMDASVAEIADAVERYRGSGIEEEDLPLAMRTGFRVALLRRLVSDQLEYVNLAKEYVSVNDFYEVVRHIVYPQRSHGKLGGKAAGLLFAWQVIRKSSEYGELAASVKVPKTWYVASDGVLEFIRFNHLEDVYARKYQEVDQIRQEYPGVIQVFKNSPFPPDLEKGLAAALDDFEDRPIIVRSSSLLEDRPGTAFSGKYKSLFLANQGSKRERLDALKDAIAEIYASIFAPDPIEYRAERGLLDVHEEMGVLMQEVVGTRVGKYYFPAFSGVAFSNNEFRWSARIRRDDGLVRLVPGLGTRAVDRVSDDYPVLIAPGQPKLRVNVSPDEVIRYSPKQIDLINLEKRCFETVAVQDLLREVGTSYPMYQRLVSIADRDRIRRPIGVVAGEEGADTIVTFDGLIAETTFVSQVRTILKVLKQKMKTPVDIEFACDGKDFYLLQCRPQSYGGENKPSPIPRDLPRESVLFRADRHVSNGRVPDITHVVYVDPQGYNDLPDRKSLEDVGRAVGRLNRMLPKRQFILMGPGRWGSRGDIRLGVSVTYADVNNTALLMEIARKKGNYVPDLSFGTHFFQDLVEAGIRYLPLYPDEEGVILNEAFLKRARNMLPDLRPEYAHLADVVRVIDVPRETDGSVLRVLMNADIDEAVGTIATPSAAIEEAQPELAAATPGRDDAWKWRLRMAERIALELDPERFGVKGFYVFGSTKNATAGPASDIDVMVHFAGTEPQQHELLVWLEGWSHCLAEMNYLRTGCRVDGLLDVHVVTDEDIAKQTSFAAKIGAVTDAARPLKMKGPGSDGEKARETFTAGA